MKTQTKEILFAIILGLVVPGMLLSWFQRKPLEELSQTSLPDESQIDSTQETQTFYLPVLMADGNVQQMELDEYLTCVVLAEMPAEFETEALKAQAVVARTYALKRYASGEKHTQGAVCTDSSCCQAYCTQADFLARGEPLELLEKVKNAVQATHDLVLTYDGALIEATYFSCSGGRTEDALAVWGADIPYLQAIDSPGEEAATHYMDTVSFSTAEFESLLGQDLTGSPGTWIGTVSYTEGGGVDTIQIGSSSYKGTMVRQLLGLRSTAFVISAVGNTVTVTTKGYGHRVGMSQYGADAMAVQGSGYEEILSYYYQGTTLQTWQG